MYFNATRNFTRTILAGLCAIFIVSLTPTTHADHHGPGWTRVEKIPEKYSRLLLCAELGNAVCQYWMGQLWLGEDRVSPGLLNQSELFNPPEARRWLKSAAWQGDHDAMFDYGKLHCYSAFLMEPATPARITDALAWVIASSYYDQYEMIIEGTYNCSDFEEAIELETIDPDSALADARERAKDIKAEIQANSGFRFRWIDPCALFLWIDGDNPFRHNFRMCLNTRLKDILAIFIN